MSQTKPTNDHNLRQRRLLATAAPRPVREVIARAKLYLDDRVWLSPVELKATVRQLASALEGMLDSPTPASETTGPTQAKVVVEPPPPSEPAKATHVGLALGLKGRDDYEARLFRSGPDRMTDQNGRSFNLSDYGYDTDEAYRLDLSSLREI